jgi:plastocyanin
MHRRALPFLAIVATVALAACGGAATPTPASSAATLPSVAASAPATSAAASQAAAGSPASAAACAVAPAGATATVNVSIKNFSFSPQPVQAKVGDAVAWKNDDGISHSATMDDNSCDTDTINAGSSAMLVFTAPGTYTYHCKVHPTQMKGFTVVVQ